MGKFENPKHFSTLSGNLVGRANVDILTLPVRILGRHAAGFEIELGTPAGKLRLGMAYPGVGTITEFRATTFLAAQP